ncbi:hypothetical protein E2C01_063130 [Portunus trituberculatus]|uniref:Uncharacterized protein n=1 Tax=Portunus trituberculatus TaxID=210409 RepID=A0A5B7HGP1_PORTR|nr:hypothetical protein [Portunus trituberculatus]
MVRTLMSFPRLKDHLCPSFVPPEAKGQQGPHLPTQKECSWENNQLIQRMKWVTHWPSVKQVTYFLQTCHLKLMTQL